MRRSFVSSRLAACVLLLNPSCVPREAKPRDSDTGGVTDSRPETDSETAETETGETETDSETAETETGETETGETETGEPETLADRGLRLEGSYKYGYAGGAIASAGDLDGDGAAELLVGASNESADDERSGAVYLLSPGALSSGDAQLVDAGLQIVGDGAYSGAGADVAGAHDLNGDGRSDIVIASAHNPYDSGASGLVYAFTSLDPTGGAVASVNDAEGSFACDDSRWTTSVATASDVDGDGIGDVIVGCPGDGMGVTYVLHGPLSGSLSSDEADAALDGGDPGFWAGTMVRAVNDVDGDGLGDLMVGGWDSSSETVEGHGYIVSGAEATGEADLADLGLTFTGEAPGDDAGSHVGAAGDVDDDGLEDVLIGAWGSGTVYLLLGGVGRTSGSLGLADADTVFSSAETLDGTGAAVSGAGDLDGDGDADLLIGAPWAGSFAGAVYVVRGPAPSGRCDLGTVGELIPGVTPDDFAGSTIAALGDINGDGRDDVAIGAPYADTTEEGGGVVYLLLGPL